MKKLLNNMVKRKRGLSPVVATVLLIVMVIVIGLIIFLWFRGMTEEVVTKWGKNVAMVCDEVEFAASCSDGTLYITNDGNVPIYGMQVKVYNEGSHSTISLRDNDNGEWTSTGLGQGGIFAGGTFSGYTKLVLIPVLMGESDAGKRPYVCEDRYGLEI